MPLQTTTPRPAEHERLSYWLGQVALVDKQAFVVLYNATAPHLLGVAMMIVKRRERAEEVLQEAYVNVWHSAGRYAQTDASPMSWLISIVRNKSLDHLRASRESDTHTSFDDEATHHLRDSAPDALTLLATASEQLGVRQCMASLDAPLRQSLALAYYEGLSHRDVSARLRAPLGTVKTWLRRAADKMRECLEMRGAHL